MSHIQLGLPDNSCACRNMFALAEQINRTIGSKAEVDVSLTGSTWGICSGISRGILSRPVFSRVSSLSSEREIIMLCGVELNCASREMLRLQQSQTVGEGL